MKIKITPDQEDWIVRKSLKKAIKVLERSGIKDDNYPETLDSLRDALTYYSVPEK